MLSMYGSDIIHWAPDLRTFLEAFVEGDRQTATTSVHVPFWSDIIDSIGLSYPGRS